MRFARGFIAFWIDFIIGDAWEVAAGVALVLVAIAIAVDRWGGRPVAGFALLAVVLAVNWLVLHRATADARRR